jgi:Protein of unknown function (DUF1553)
MWRPCKFPPPERATATAYSQSPWPVSTGLKRTAPTSETTCIRRDRSNTPLQALTLLNDAVFVEAAQAMARRIIIECPERSVDARARRAFRLCLTRSPRPEELARLTAFYEHQLARFRSGELDAAKIAGLGIKGPPTPLLCPSPPPGTDTSELAAWTTVARVLLNLDETVTKE